MIAFGEISQIGSSRYLLYKGSFIAELGWYREIQVISSQEFFSGDEVAFYFTTELPSFMS